jgi:hypothetical protein
MYEEGTCCVYAYQFSLYSTIFINEVKEEYERKIKAEEIRAICKGRRHQRKGKRKGCVERRM